MGPPTSFSPISAAISSAIMISRAGLRLSPNSAVPMNTAPTAPMPVQMA
ncbi:hypothetical protein [Deinococcus radiopugnans]|nr:hypothetical protein [Deinococcus radiopugnans]